MATFLDIDTAFNLAVLNAGFSVPVITENIDYSPKVETPFIAAYLLPAPTSQASLGDEGCDNHSGLYQIDINYPKDKGTTELKAMADNVNAVFYSGAVFTYNNVSVNIRNVSINRVVVQDGWAALTMTIEFYTYVSRV